MKTVGFFLLLSLYLTYSTYTLTQTDIQGILDHENNQRSTFSMPPFVWNTSLSSDSLVWANACVFTHSQPNGAYGENLAAYGSGSDATFPYESPSLHVDDWNSEQRYWNCQTNKCNATCGHFTQNVWKTTTSVGCGLGRCPQGSIFPGLYAQFLVCRFYPAGNIGSQHPFGAPATTYSGCLSTTTPITPTVPPTAPPTSPPTAPPTNIIPPTNITPPTAPPTSMTPLTNMTPPTAPPTSMTPPTTPPTSMTPPTTPPTSMTPPTAPPTSMTPPTAPPTAPYSGCLANYFLNNVPQKNTHCIGTPWTPTGSNTLYCPCGDPKGFSWPVLNSGTSACPFVASEVDDSSARTLHSGLTSSEWAGIGVGLVVFVVLIAVVAFIIRKKTTRSEIV